MLNNRSDTDLSFETWVNEVQDEHLLDDGWARFMKDGNQGWFKLMSRAACETPELIATSEVFGQNVQAIQEALAKFHSDADANFQELSVRLRKVGNTYRAQVAQYAVMNSGIIECSVDALVGGNQMNGILVTESFLSTCQMTLEASSVEKAGLLVSGRFPDFFDASKTACLHGTLLVDVPFIGVSSGQVRALAISLQSPLDAFYFPAHRLIVRSSTLRFSCFDRLPKLFNWILRNIDLYQNFWQQPATSNIRYLVRDKRPYHVLLDELSGRFELQESGFELDTLFFERASFLENSQTINFTQPEQNVYTDLLISNHRRADKDDFSSRYYAHLKYEASRHHAGIHVPIEANTIIWLSISGGEKRRWFEEREALVAFIRWARDRYSNCHFYVDGWTSSLVMTNADKQQIAQHNEIWQEIRATANVTPSEYTSFIGAGVLRKVWGAGRCSFFISCAGTPSVWPSLIGRLPGVVHNSVSMIRRVQNTYFPDNVVRVADAHIHDVNEIGDKIRWDKYSYSIQPEEILRCAEQAWEISYDKIEHFYDVLVAARKQGNGALVQALETLLRKKFSSYRNLEHLLKSSAYFGSPDVKILTDNENFRVIDCNVNRTSDVLFITFGIVSSHLDHLPFAHAFLSVSGFKHIHVAQKRKTSYQSLSFEHFSQLLAPLAARFRYRFTYGTSLGGYAALYYASAINAHAIASAPRLPLHPENLKFKGTLWRPGSHWDETEYEHLPFSSVVTATCPDPFVIYDPCDPIDSNFVKNCIVPFFPTIRFLEVLDSNHAPLEKLLRKGQLKKVIHDHVVSVQGN